MVFGNEYNQIGMEVFFINTDVQLFLSVSSCVTTYCNYQASMTVYKKGENDYEATIHNQMIEGGGKAEPAAR